VSRQPTETVTEWLRGEGNAGDVVMSSRVRLARNLSTSPFVNKANRPQRQEVLDSCRNRILSAGLTDRMVWLDLHETPPVERTLLVERHLISQQHARGKQSTGAGGQEEPRGVAVSVPDERVSIMVNEEDHLRLQVIRCGMDLARTLEDAGAIDDKLEAGLDFAFSPRFGYLTACPTNVGTGIRLSVMMHLPGLRLTGNMEKVKRAAADMSLAVRGFYGEGSEAAGDFYQISNQTTLGKTEQMLLHELDQQIMPQVIEYERVARKTMLTKRRADLEDQVFRALGALTHARLMTTEEAMQHLSMLRLGVLLGVVTHIDQVNVNRMMLLVQPAHVQKVAGRELDQDQRRAARAELLRTRLGAR
jgi:protein arginine kinase